MTAFIGRREFITLVGGAAAVWPFAARAQQGERTRRIGVLSHLSENDPTAQQFVAAFRQRLQELGWVDGRNARIDIYWGAGDDALSDTRRNWSLARPMSFWRRQPRQCWR
jgi:putative ABC transport system substrate-binding protein